MHLGGHKDAAKLWDASRLRLGAGRGCSTEAGVALVLPGGEPELRFVRFVVEEERERGRLPLDDLLILSCLQSEPRLALAEAAARVQKPAAEAQAVLLRLRERGLIETRGASGSGVWRLSEALRRRLNARLADRPAQTLDLREHEQLVLEHARRYGRVTRRDAAALCRISARQASYVLSRLARSGDLVMHGARRGAWYEPQ